MKLRTILFAVIILLPAAAVGQPEAANVVFWKELQKLCGENA